MPAKSLLKLIDEAIIPALVLILSKMAGLFLAIYFLNLSFTLNQREIFGLLPAIRFLNLTDFITAQNYSNLAMFTVAAFGTVLVLIRAHFFHQTHISPQLQAKLASLNLEGLIASTYQLYHQALIWLVFLWLTVGFLILSSALNITAPQIPIAAFVVAANLSWVFAADVEKEIEMARGRV